MKSPVLAIVCAATLSSCSGGSAEALPPLANIKEATLDYANCVNQSATKLAAQPGRLEDLEREAVDSCAALRAKALDLKSVPVMFPTVAAFDTAHLSVARFAIESARTKAG